MLSTKIDGTENNSLRWILESSKRSLDNNGLSEALVAVIEKHNALSEKVTDKNIEALSDYQHQIWAHWMKYMFSCGTLNSDGDWVMPKEKVERWKRQMETPYSELTEKEKESDRNQVKKFKHLI